MDTYEETMDNMDFFLPSTQPIPANVDEILKQSTPIKNLKPKKLTDKFQSARKNFGNSKITKRPESLKLKSVVGQKINYNRGFHTFGRDENVHWFELSKEDLRFRSGEKISR